MKDHKKSKELGETCIICEQIKSEGIHLHHAFLCSECEQKMIQTNTTDPSYDFYVQKLKNHMYSKSTL